MDKKTEISAAELEVMQVLWEADIPLRVQEVCDRLPESRWKYKTVATLLMRMEEKGAVSSEKEGKANRYHPLLDRECYQKEQTKNFVKRLYNGSVKDLAVSLFRSDDLSEADIAEIRELFRL